MNRQLSVDLFVEDRAHEEFIKAVLERLANEAGAQATVRTRAARGGHGRAIAEFKLYQQLLCQGNASFGIPDFVVVAIDANCRRFNEARDDIRQVVVSDLTRRVAIACPDPHIEMWYLADPDAVHSAVGERPKVGKRKCERDRYKEILLKTIRSAGHPPTLGGIEFARDIVRHLDWYKAERNQASFRHFLRELRPLLAVGGFLD